MAEKLSLKSLDDALRKLQEETHNHHASMDSLQSTVNTLALTVQTQQKQMGDALDQLGSITDQLVRLGQLVKDKPTSSQPDTTQPQTQPRYNPEPNLYHTRPAPANHHPHHHHDSDASDDEFPFKPKPARVELPRFDGDDRESWLHLAEEFFDFYKTEDSVRITMAAFHLDGKARRWYRWMKRNGQLVSWNQFSRALVTRLKLDDYESAQAQLAKLTQSTTVEEYQSRFENLSNQTTGLPPTFLVDCFLSGLRPDIKNEVLPFRPTTMNHAISLARLQESKLAESRRLQLRQWTPQGRRPPGPPVLATPPPIRPETHAAQIPLGPYVA